jgi:hypothetical protein
MKIRPVGAELFHVEVQTNTTKLIVAFRNFAAAPEDDNRSVERSRSDVWYTSSDDVQTSAVGRPAASLPVNTALWCQLR